MEKKQNRNDLLAAGRKKLEQYRQKKDKRASSASRSKHEHKRDSLEPENSVSADTLNSVSTEPVCPMISDGSAAPDSLITPLDEQTAIPVEFDHSFALVSELTVNSSDEAGSSNTDGCLVYTNDLRIPSEIPIPLHEAEGSHSITLQGTDMSCWKHVDNHAVHEIESHNELLIRLEVEKTSDRTCDQEADLLGSLQIDAIHIQNDIPLPSGNDSVLQQEKECSSDDSQCHGLEGLHEISLDSGSHGGFTLYGGKSSEHVEKTEERFVKHAAERGREVLQCTMQMDDVHIEVHKEHSVDSVFGSNDSACNLDVLHLKKCQEDLSFTCKHQNPSLPGDNFCDFMENMRQHLYLVSISKDILTYHLHNDVSKPQVLSDEAQERNKIIDGSFNQIGVEIITAAVPSIEQEARASEDTMTKQHEDYVCELSSSYDKSREMVAQLAFEKEELEVKLLTTVSDIEDLTAEVFSLRNHIDKLENENRDLSVELTNCRVMLERYAVENANLKADFASISEEKRRFGVEKQQIVDHNIGLTAELHDQKEQLNALLDKQHKLVSDKIEASEALEHVRNENTSLIANISLILKDREKLELEKEHYAYLNDKLAAEICDYKGQLCSVLGKQSKLHSELKEAVTVLEDVSEENLCLSYSLLINEATFSELNVDCTHLHAHSDSNTSQIESHNASGNVDKRTEKSSAHVEGVDKDPVAMLERVELGTAESSFCDGASCDHSDIMVMKDHLKGAQVMLQKLETAIKDMHIRAAAYTTSGRKGPSGVSKLIEAFEMKAYSSEASSVGESNNETEGPGPLKLAESQASYLRDTLEQLELMADRIYGIFRKENDLKELAVRELEHQCQIEKAEKCEIQSKNNELIRKVSICQMRIENLLDKTAAIQCNADAVMNTASSQLEHVFGEVGKKIFIFEKARNQIEIIFSEMNQKISLLENEKNSLLSNVQDVVQKLQTTIKVLVFPCLQSINGLDIISSLASTTDDAINAIGKLHTKLQAAYLDQERLLNSYAMLDQKVVDINDRKGVAIEQINKTNESLMKLISDLNANVEEVEEDLHVDDMPAIAFVRTESLLQHLKKLMDQTMYNASLKDELATELARKVQVIEELEERCISLRLKSEEVDKEYSCTKIAQNVVKDIEHVIHLDGEILPVGGMPRHLEAVIALFIRKYEDTIEQLNLSKKWLKEVTRRELPSDYWLHPVHVLIKDEFNCCKREANEMQTELEILNTSKFQWEEEMYILRESLFKMEEDLSVARSELNAKVSELEQEKQRLSSAKEKLNKAIMKGKGLVLQRDDLKQSRAEKSCELERCLKELQSKDIKFLEMEGELRILSESSGRIEALESELSYIRNSSVALRESFLLKDSVLHRIEEVLEELKYPEHVHQRDIIDKVRWLARFVAGSSVPEVVSDAGPLYSDTGYVISSNWNNQQSMSHAGPYDLRIKYDELESKFYSLAEHNEMLEQSLQERISIMQQWEDMLDKMDAPTDVRSSTARFEWLIKALGEAQHEREFNLCRIKNLEILSQSQVTEKTKLHAGLSDVAAILVGKICEREFLSENMKLLTFEYEKLLEKGMQLGSVRSIMVEEITSLKEQLTENTGKHLYMEKKMIELWNLVTEALPDDEVLISVPNAVSIHHIEELIRKFIAHHRASCLGHLLPTNREEHLDNCGNIEGHNSEIDVKELELSSLREELATTLCQMSRLEEEKEKVVDKNMHLISEVEEIGKQRDELQNLLLQEEHKSASMKEKLNVAVRKGKGLVQQRDHLKETIQEMNHEADCLKLQLANKTTECITLSEKIITMESELSTLKVRCKETEKDANKSKGKADLLETEVNEFRERANCLQEEITKAELNILKLSKEKGTAESARSKALSDLDQLNKQHNVFFQELVPFMDKLSDDCCNFANLFVGVLSSDAKLFCHVESVLCSALKEFSCPTASECRAHTFSSITLQDEVGIFSPTPKSNLRREVQITKSDPFETILTALQDCSRKIGSLKKICNKHVSAVDEHAFGLPKIIQAIQEQLHIQKEHSEAMNRENAGLEALVKKKNAEVDLLYKATQLFYEACTKSIQVLDKKKLHIFEMPLQLPAIVEEDSHTKLVCPLTDDSIGQVANALLSAVKASQSEVECQHAELKGKIISLQKEAQEKEIQTNKICSELVSQIRDAEATANSYLIDLQTTKERTEGLEKVVEDVRSQKMLFEEKLNAMDTVSTTSKELEEKVESLSGIIALKEHEIESLMQALDEEETQMEGLTKKIEELEKMDEQKNTALEKLESARKKASTKLSTTLSKFNELHTLSESLISEIEMLQQQLEDRDAEISFLRQEIEKCTTHVLDLQERSKKSSCEVTEIISWLKAMATRFTANDFHFDDGAYDQMHSCMKTVEDKITSLTAELDELRGMGQSRDILLETERRDEKLSNSVGEKKSKFMLLQERDLGQFSLVDKHDIADMNNKAISLRPVAHVRDARQSYGDQAAVDVDLEYGNSSLLDEDDDKGHDFKSFAMSGVVPRVIRPLADKMDGIWISGGRMLMRQPCLRLGVVIYWFVLHVLLATTII